MTLRRWAFLLLLLLFSSAIADDGGDELRRRAEKGDAAAQLQLGNEFFFGRGRPVNPMLALYWYRAAADNNVAEAQYNLGCCYSNGWGTAVDRRLAYYYFEKAASHDLIPAKLKLAELLFAGVPESEALGWRLVALPAAPDKAIEMVQSLAEKDYVPAMETLAEFLFLNQDVRNARGEDIRRWLSKAYQSKNISAEGLLLYATVLQDGIGGPPKSRESFAAVERAVAMGNPEAKARMAQLLENGFGCQVDKSKALELLKSSADVSPFGMVLLGKHYLVGDIVEHDPKKAFALFERAMQQQYPAAWREAGICYQLGVGVEANPEKAFELFDLAARAGDAEAAYRIGVAYRDGIGVANDDTAAFYWFRKAALEGHSGALRESGIALLHGKGCDVNVELGKKLIIDAAQAGDGIAAGILQNNQEYNL